jgi:hypothetical protein
MVKKVKDVIRKNPFLKSKADKEWGARNTSNKVIKNDKPTQNDAQFGSDHIPAYDRAAHNQGYNDHPDTVSDGSALSELSKATLGRYAQRATNDVRNSNQAIGRRDKGDIFKNIQPDRISDPEQRAHHKGQLHLAKKREKGLRMAIKKLTKEDVIAEISKKVLGSYVKKAADSYSRAEGDWRDADVRLKKAGEFTDKAALRGRMASANRDTVKRRAGIGRAVNRLVKEQEDDYKSVKTYKIKYKGREIDKTMSGPARMQSDLRKTKDVNSKLVKHWGANAKPRDKKKINEISNKLIKSYLKKAPDSERWNRANAVSMDKTAAQATKASKDGRLHPDSQKLEANVAKGAAWQANKARKNVANRMKGIDAAVRRIKEARLNEGPRMKALGKALRSVYDGPGGFLKYSAMQAGAGAAIGGMNGLGAAKGAAAGLAMGHAFALNGVRKAYKANRSLQKHRPEFAKAYDLAEEALDEITKKDLLTAYGAQSAEQLTAIKSMLADLVKKEKNGTYVDLYCVKDYHRQIEDLYDRLVGATEVRPMAKDYVREEALEEGIGRRIMKTLSGSSRRKKIAKAGRAKLEKGHATVNAARAVVKSGDGPMSPNKYAKDAAKKQADKGRHMAQAGATRNQIGVSKKTKSRYMGNK